MLCAIQQALSGSHKAIVALVVWCCLLNVMNACAAQSMNTLPLLDFNTADSAAHSMHGDIQHENSHRGDSHHHRGSAVDSAAVMPCCDDKSSEYNELAAELCCEPVDALVAASDKPLFTVVIAYQAKVSLWSLLENPPLVTQALIKPPATNSFPPRHLTLGVQLI